MANRDDLQIWVTMALSDFGGRGSVVEIAKWIWENHEGDLRSSGDLFYRWQYDMRWAEQKLQQAGKLKKHRSPREWELIA